MLNEVLTILAVLAGMAVLLVVLTRLDPTTNGRAAPAYKHRADRGGVASRNPEA
jgi:hypothetical protein